MWADVKVIPLCPDEDNALMKINVTSNNQSGGTTAHTVNQTTHSPLAPVKPSSTVWDRLGLWLGVAVAIVSAIAGVWAVWPK